MQCTVNEAIHQACLPLAIICQVSPAPDSPNPLLQALYTTMRHLDEQPTRGQTPTLIPHQWCTIHPLTMLPANLLPTNTTKVALAYSAGLIPHTPDSIHGYDISITDMLHLGILDKGVHQQFDIA